MTDELDRIEELAKLLDDRADHYLHRAEIMAKYADTVDRSDPYAKVADADADSEHVLAATMREAAALIRQLKAENERMRAGFERQTENMAFILNHATLPEQWYEKFCRELEEDRAAQSLNQTERGE